MKLNNHVLGLALADYAVGHEKQTELMQLANYILTHPMSRVYTERALIAMGILPEHVPDEMWAADLPIEAAGAERLKAAITTLNEQWHTSRFARMIAVRNLAWHATQLGRRLEQDLQADTKRVIQRNGGSTAGLLSAFIATPMTRAELNAAVVPT